MAIHQIKEEPTQRGHALTFAEKSTSKEFIRVHIEPNEKEDFLTLLIEIKNKGEDPLMAEQPLPKEAIDKALSLESMVETLLVYAERALQKEVNTRLLLLYKEQIAGKVGSYLKEHYQAA